MNTLNIALLAHVDAGKTSLTEQLLFQSGALKKVGHVDKGTSVSDYLKVEKDRGISVLASHLSLVYKGLKINIIDTPGHADFISEVERSLWAVDMVVLLVSAFDGVQAQTQKIWSLIRKLKLPCLLLIHKSDYENLDAQQMLSEIRSELLINAHLKGTEEIDLVIAESDEQLMNQYIEGDELNRELLEKAYLKLYKNGDLFPVILASSKTGSGIIELLDELKLLSNAFTIDIQGNLYAVIFKINIHSQLGKICYARVFSGQIEAKQIVYNHRLKSEEKVNMLKEVFSDQLSHCDLAKAGDIVAISGFNSAAVGDFLGERDAQDPHNFNTIPTLKTQVKAVDETDYFPLSSALNQLNQEDPLLGFEWVREEREFHLRINGKIQIEILQQIIWDRYRIKVVFEKPSIIYKETPAQAAFGFDAYTMPKPCWAVVKFEIKPGAQGSGVVYHSKIGVNDVLLKYQKEVERAIPRSLEQGIKGWEVTDIEISLVEGEDHVMHSRPGDFTIVTPMAIMDGLAKAGSILLEPIFRFYIEAPEEFLGSITSDILMMRGEFEQPQIIFGKCVLRGFVPLSTALDYEVKLASKTAGRAHYFLSFDRYRKVDDSLGVIREYKGISPLDRSKYILKARKAIQ